MQKAKSNFEHINSSTQGVVDTVAADLSPTTARMRTFAFSSPLSVQSMIVAAPGVREAPRFLKLATLLFAMLDLPLWTLIAAAACAGALTLLCARVC